MRKIPSFSEIQGRKYRWINNLKEDATDINEVWIIRENPRSTFTSEQHGRIKSQPFYIKISSFAFFNLFFLQMYEKQRVFRTKAVDFNKDINKDV